MGSRADLPGGPAAGTGMHKRSVRVFVSSTFRDMGAERDELMSQAWPEVRRFCRERQVEFVEVDLRWGVSEAQSSRRETLKLCLDEIRACRPYFIGLLGERYGWVPGYDAFTPDLEEEQPWITELGDRSVTELEIIHGVLNDPEMASRAFFYFRDPAYASCRGPDYQAESPEAAARQVALKGRIRATCRERDIPLREDYADPSSLAEMIQADLEAAIGTEYPVETIPDPLDREAREHEAYAEHLRRVYIGRRAYGDKLDQHAMAQGGPLVVLGESGSGKSALLANWLRGWQEAHPGDFVFQHYTGATASSVTHWGLLSRLVKGIKRWAGDPASPPATHDDMIRMLPEWLARLRVAAERRGVRAIVVLDALNQLEERDGAGRLGWLPEEAFAGALRLVVSSLPGETLDAIVRRGWPALCVEPLAEAERRQLIESYLARFSKRLDEKRLRRLAGAPAAASPLYLKLLLDELRVTGTHERLDERLESYLAASDTPALLDQILTRWEAAYERDRPGLVGAVLSLLWAARRGLSESELLSILRPPGLPQLPAALWAPLRAALDESLADRNGILGFAHDFLRGAVEQRYAAGDERQRALRRGLAGYFEEQGATSRACDELPWLLRKAGDRDRLRTCLLDIGRLIKIMERDQDEVLADWVWLGEVEAIGGLYQVAFEAWERVAGAAAEPSEAAYTADAIGSLLFNAGQYAHALPIVRRAVSLRERAPGASQLDLTTSLNNLGLLLRGIGDLEGARSCLERALAICEQVLGERDPETAMSLNNLGVLLRDTGDVVGARAILERALAIDLEALGERHLETAHTLNNLGMILQASGDLPGARPYLERALAACQGLLGERHPTTAAGLNNLGLLLRAMGNLAGSRPYLERTLAVQREMLGERHPDTARTMTSLGNVLREMGDLDGARPYLERALSIQSEVLGERHTETALALSNLGMLLQTMGDYAGARHHFERALSIQLEVAGERHPVTAQILNNLGAVLHAVGDLAGARSCFERALASQREVLGERHGDTARGLSNLAAVLQAQGDLSGALPYLEKALAIQQDVLGERHTETATTLHNLGTLLMGMGRLAEARPVLERALAVQEDVLGEHHPLAAKTLDVLGMLLQSLGDLAGAQHCFERALAIQQPVLGEMHPDTAASLYGLGLVYLSMGDAVGAHRHLERALAIRLQILGERHPDTAAVLQAMGVLLQATGNLEEARSCLERALAVQQEMLGERHPTTAGCLLYLGLSLAGLGELEEAQRAIERAHGILQEVYGEGHPDTAMARFYVGMLLLAEDDLEGAERCFRQALEALEASMGSQHATTQMVRNALGALMSADDF